MEPAKLIANPKHTLNIRSHKVEARSSQARGLVETQRR